MGPSGTAVRRCGVPSIGSVSSFARRSAQRPSPFSHVGQSQGGACRGTRAFRRSGGLRRFLPNLKVEFSGRKRDHHHPAPAASHPINARAAWLPSYAAARPEPYDKRGFGPLLRVRLAVGHQPLELRTVVRIHVAEPGDAMVRFRELDMYPRSSSPTPCGGVDECL